MGLWITLTVTWKLINWRVMEGWKGFIARQEKMGLLNHCSWFSWNPGPPFLLRKVKTSQITLTLKRRRKKITSAFPIFLPLL